MKNNLFKNILGWILATSVILSVVFCLQFVFRTRDLRVMQGEVARYQSVRQMLGTLIPELEEYSKHNSDILPILAKVGIRPRTNAPAATAVKPAK